MDILTAMILGAFQGLMEFLPVSANGHLILAQEIVEIEYVSQVAMSGVLHLATALAIILYFWNDIWVLIQTLMRKMGRLPVNEKDLVLSYALLIGTIPGVILGFMLEPVFEKYFTNALTVAVVLMLSAFFFMYAEWRYYLCAPYGEITVNKGFRIGLFQVLALIPGFSRTGATIAGGMLIGLTRYESTRFSFLLAIPLTLGFGLKKLLDVIVVDGEVDWMPIIVGGIVSFFVALVVIRLFLGFIRRYTLWPFIWYSLILSSLTIYYLVFVQ